MFSVVTPAPNKKLTTLANVKIELGIAPGDISEDAKLNRLIDRISAMVVDYAYVPSAVDGSKTFALETLEQKFFKSPWYGSGCRILQLARRPVTEIVSVSIGATTIDPADYDFDGGVGTLWRTGAVVVPTIAYVAGQTTKVRFKAGWTVPNDDNDPFTLPLPLEGSVIGMIRSARFAADRDPTVKSEWTTDIERIDYWVGQIGENGAFPPDIASTIDDYCYEMEFG